MLRVTRSANMREPLCHRHPVLEGGRIAVATGREGRLHRTALRFPRSALRERRRRRQLLTSGSPSALAAALGDRRPAFPLYLRVRYLSLWHCCLLAYAYPWRFSAVGRHLHYHNGATAGVSLLRRCHFTF